MAMGKTGAGGAVLFSNNRALAVSMISLAATIVVALLGRGLLRLIPIICGIAAGYLSALLLGMVDFAPILQATWLAVPAFVVPRT